MRFSTNETESTNKTNDTFLGMSGTSVPVYKVRRVDESGEDIVLWKWLLNC